MRTMWGVALVMAIIASVGCKKNVAPEAPTSKSTESSAASPTANTVVHPRAMELPTTVPGLSGLTVDEHGALWAPAERKSKDHPLTVLRIDPNTLGVTAYTVVGMPGNIDLESIAWLDGTRFVLGTEGSGGGRDHDVVLEGHLEGENFVVTPSPQLDYTRWGIAATANHGIEGICQVDGVLVLAAELQNTLDDGRRWAPVAVYAPNTKSWTAHWVLLEGAPGGLSALDCRSKGDKIEVLAIQRNEKDRRLLRFTLPRGTEAQRVEAVEKTQLTTETTGPNFEGLAWMPDGSVYLLNDNQLGRHQIGKSYLYFLAANEIR